MRPVRPSIGYALVAGAATSWGTWSLFFRPAERRGPLSPEIEALVVMIAIAVFPVPLAIRDSRARAGKKRPWSMIAALGIFDAMNILLFFRAMTKTSLAIAVLSHSLAPIFIAAVAPLVTGETARARTWVTTIAALAGLTLLLEPWASPSQGAVVGALLGAGSAVFYAANVLVQKRFSDAFSPAELMAYHAAPSAVVIALAVPTGGWAIEASQAAILGGAALGPGAIAGIAFVTGLFAIPASHAAVVALLEPVVAVLIGIVVWHEPLRPLGVVGATMVLGAVYATIRS